MIGSRPLAKKRVTGSSTSAEPSQLSLERVHLLIPWIALARKRQVRAQARAGATRSGKAMGTETSRLP